MITAQSDVGFLRRVILKHVRDAFVSPSKIGSEWETLNYLSEPDFSAALSEYDNFAAILVEEGCELVYQGVDEATSLDSLYVRDASIVTDAGIILCNMGKTARLPEPSATARLLEREGLQIIGSIESPGTVEGGDVTWLGPGILAVGESYRTNQQGIEQLVKLLGTQVNEVIVASLPHFRGPGDILHLMSLLSPVANDLAVVYSPLLPIKIRNRMLELGYRLVEVPEAEFDSMGSNVLALGPRTCLMVDGNPVTRERLEAAGMKVIVYPGNEISAKGCGGPTCLTRPLQREL